MIAFLNIPFFKSSSVVIFFVFVELSVNCARDAVRRNRLHPLTFLSPEAALLLVSSNQKESTWLYSGDPAVLKLQIT